MIKDVVQFAVQHVQVMDDEGNADDSLLPQLSADEIRTMYWHMICGRALDRKMLAMQREGRLGTFASTEGQEACQVGSAIQLRKQDWMTIAFRENVACLVRGISMSQLLLYWGGDERGSKFADDQRTLPVSIPVGSQPLHAVGLAWAAKYFGRDEVALTYFGDGATSEGEFHEALNIAAAQQTPVIFLCQNNQYAISTPETKQTHSQTIAQKGIAYGMPCVQVDGNDVFAVYRVTKEAIERAKSGGGPTMIEAVTYRLGNHTTADDYKHYRKEEEVAAWRKRDPIDRLRKFMEKRGMWDDNHEQGAWQHAEELVEAAIKEFEAVKPQPLTDLWDYLFAKLPAMHEEQKKAFLAMHGGSQ